jgi:16S rRNA (uracil1498-N3)-methyltransferase
MGRRWRLFHPEAGRAAEGDELVLDAAESHHASRVLRLAAGEVLGVFDGAGGERLATITAVGPLETRVQLGARLDDPVEPPLAVTLWQARARSERIDLVVQKATELGAAGVMLVEFERAEGPAADERRLDRWRRIALEACKQSGRRRLPEIAAARTLPAPGAGPSAPLALLLDPGPQSVPFVDVPPPAAGSPVWLAVGPEGGLAAEERERARAAGWLAVSLGPRILRTETAGVVAVALALHRFGDLGALARRPAAP